MTSNKNKSSFSSAFTIIEVIIVVVIIGILAAIVMVSYSSVQKKAVAASLQSDLINASQEMNLFYMDNGVYPTTISTDCVASPDTDTNKCLKVSGSNTYIYNYDNNTDYGTFGLTATNTNWNISYRVVKDSGVVACAPGFIIVPGSKTYGTSDFCVMKYEASRSNATSSNEGWGNTPISKAGILQWINVSKNTAIVNSSNVVGCTGCHLITESEWLTIAQNVLSVNSNWSSGTVGTDYIYSGHNDNAPANALLTDPSGLDADGYYGETNKDGNQRRTLTLTNGEVIWDLAGNIWEWVVGQTTGGQPGITGESTFGWKEWNASPMTIGNLAVNPFPSYGTPASSGWDAETNGIGRLYSNVGDTSPRDLARSGDWHSGSNVGVFTLSLDSPLDDACSDVGFRVAR